MKHRIVIAAALTVAVAAGACSSGDDATRTTDELTTSLPVATSVSLPAGVEVLEVNRNQLRPLAELSGDEVPIPTVMVIGLDLGPMIVEAEGDAQAIAGEPANQRSLSVSRSPDIVTDRVDPPERVIDVAGVTWEFRTFDDLTFATAADPGVAVTGIGLDQSTVEAVLNGLRSGPLEAFPTGSYRPDDGAATVFRRADDGVSLEYATVGGVPCWTLRSTNSSFGNCAAPRVAPDGVVVLVRYAPLLSDGTIGTVVYTAGVVPTDTTAVEVAGFDGVAERVEVADISGDHDVEFFIARSSFDPDRDVSTTTVTVVE